MATIKQPFTKTPDGYEAEITKLIAEKESLEKELQLYKESESQTIRFANQLTRFTNQLNTAASISKQLSSILDIDLLLQEIVTLLKNRFHLYHVHVYLLDETDETLRLHAGSGKIGRQMRDAKHSISLHTERSLVAKAARSLETIWVDDVSQEPFFLPNPLLPDTQSEIALPLVLGEKVFGVLDLQDDESHRFDAIDLDTFDTFSGHIASAIQNAYLFAEQKEAENALRQYANRLQSLNEIDKAILTAESPEKIAQTAIQQLRLIIPYHRASVSIFDHENKEVWFYTADNYDDHNSLATNYDINIITTALEKNNGQPIIGNIDAFHGDIPIIQSLKEQQIQSIIIYPLSNRKELIGAINLASKDKDAFNQGDIAFVDEIAAPLAIAIQQAWLNEELRQHTKALEARNEELEQFAYVASHDLQEPLRIVISYVQLLARQYEGQLDEDADIFIKYAIDAAMRMKNLISDLLSYSRLDKHGKSFTKTDMNKVLANVLLDLSLTIEENKAVITYDPLPTVMADNIQMSQVFLNLISNGIKFQGEATPQIHLSAIHQNNMWIFSVKDNGIGIDPKYTGRIFSIFQRLHTTEEYPGTGIGLAICKKIIERHNGQIWVESMPGEGTTFSFSLPG